MISAASAGGSAEPSLSKQGHGRCNRYNRSITVWGQCESALAADAITLLHRATLVFSFKSNEVFESTCSTPLKEFKKKKKSVL